MSILKCVIMIWFLASHITETNGGYQSRFWIIFGEAQAGKTTFSKTYTRDTYGVTGDGSGQSQTTEQHVYNTKLTNANNGKIIEISMMDTVGFLDSNVTLTDTEIMHSIVKSIVSSNEGLNMNGGDAIILVESLLDGTTQLRRNIKRIMALFTEQILHSMVVLGTKKELCEIVYKNPENRIKTVEDICREFGIPIVYWSIEDRNRIGINENQMEEQRQKLLRVTETVEVFKMSLLEETQKKILQIAQEIMQNTTKRTQLIEYETKCEYPCKKEVKDVKCQTKYHSSSFMFGLYEESYSYETCHPITKIVDSICYKDCKKNKTEIIEHRVEDFLEKAKTEWQKRIGLRMNSNKNCENESSESCYI